MECDKEKLMTLYRLDAWVKGAQKDIEYITEVFERTFQKDLDNYKHWCDYNALYESIEDTQDHLNDLDTSLTDLSDSIIEAIKEMNIEENIKSN